MKGIVFTEFLEHLEASHGPLVTEDVITSSSTKTDGAYTSVGTYPCSELVSLIGSMSSHTGREMPEIIRGFGEHLAASFKRDYPLYFDAIDYFDFVEAVERRIHVDVLKLYPDAELPRFSTILRSKSKLVIDYHSARALEDLAFGLLLGTARHFAETVTISMAPFHKDGARIVRFEIQRS